MTSSINRKYLTYRNAAREDQAAAIGHVYKCIRNLKHRACIFVRRQTDRHTERHTDMLITILRFSTDAE